MTQNSEINQDALRAMLADPRRQNEGFRLLMEQYGRKLYWHIRRIVVSHDDAEDVLQEACIKILGGIDGFRGAGNLTAWLYRIATNEALHQLRRQTSLFQSIDSLSDALCEKMVAESPFDEDAAEVLFQKALLKLPTQQRLVFNLRYYDDLSYNEIAKVTGKSVATLKTNYHYATEKIKEYIKSHAK